VVPKSHLITLEMAKDTSISKLIIKNKLDLLSPKHSFLSTFLLTERRKPDSFWRPYLDVLPQEYDCLPIFYSEKELSWLEGAPFLDQVNDKIEDMKKDYNAIIEVAPEMEEFPFKEFCWARMTASSRIFGLKIEGKKTDAFVPLAGNTNKEHDMEMLTLLDMLNHRRPKQTSWAYDQEKAAFVIKAIDDIPRGEQVYDSYGKKCNSRFLMNYGFIAEDNDGNEVAVKIGYRKDDPLRKAKE